MVFQRHSLAGGFEANLSPAIDVNTGYVGFGALAPAAPVHVYGSGTVLRVETPTGGLANLQLKSDVRTFTLFKGGTGSGFANFFMLFDAMAGAYRFKVTSTFHIVLGAPNSALTDSHLNNGQISFYLDETPIP